MRTVTVLPAYVLLHGSRSEYRRWLRHINLGLGKTNDGSDPAERHVSMGDGTKDSRQRTRSTALPANSRLPRLRRRKARDTAGPRRSFADQSKEARYEFGVNSLQERFVLAVPDSEGRRQAAT